MFIKKTLAIVAARLMPMATALARQAVNAVKMANAAATNHKNPQRVLGIFNLLLVFKVVKLERYAKLLVF